MKKRIVRQVEAKLREYKKADSEAAQVWQRVITDALGEMEPGKRRLCELRYFKGLSQDAVICQLPASSNTYYAYRDDIVAIVAVKAAAAGLIDP